MLADNNFSTFNYRSGENCISISAQNGSWYDTNCDIEYRAVCQYRFIENGPFNLVAT